MIQFGREIILAVAATFFLLLLTKQHSSLHSVSVDIKSFRRLQGIPQVAPVPTNSVPQEAPKSVNSSGVAGGAVGGAGAE